MKITIPEPCQENWEAMTPKEKGKHCDKCAKQVVDFTQMSDGQLVDYMQSNPGSCGRFYNFQLNKELEPTLKPQNKWLTKVAVGTLALSQMFPENVTAQHEWSAKKDTICNIATVPSSYGNFAESKVIEFSFDTSDSLIQTLKRLVFDIDSFQIGIDDLESGNVRFSIPESLSWDSFAMHFYYNNQVEQDTIYVTKAEINNQFMVNNSFILARQNDAWKVSKSAAWTPVWPQDIITMGGMQPEITMGIPPLPYEVGITPFDISEITFTEITISQTMGYSQHEELTGDTILINAQEFKKDSMQLEMEKEISYQSKPSNNWHWALTMALAFVGSIAAFVFSGKKK